MDRRPESLRREIVSVAAADSGGCRAAVLLQHAVSCSGAHVSTCPALTNRRSADQVLQPALRHRCASYPVCPSRRRQASRPGRPSCPSHH